MANTRLQRLPGSTGNNSKNTFSVWLKRASIDTEDFIVYGFYDSNYRYKATFLTNGKLHLNTVIGGSNNLSYTTNRVFRDTSAWYHIVIAFDSTLGTAGDRCRLYVNGVEETSFATEEHMGSNTSNFMSDNAATVYIGSQATANYFNGSMSHIHFCDGYQYQPSDFAETDTDTGEWRIKENLSVSYGTNGFFILKDGNSVTDQSGNSNNFTINVGAGGGLNKTEDCPNNVFCTLNPLARYGANLNFSYGNNSVTETNSNWAMSSSTLGASTGKFYYEYKITTTASSGNAYQKLGFISDEAYSNSASHFADPALDGGYAFYVNNGNLEVRNDNAVISGYDQSTLATSFTTNDIMCLAVDMTNKRAYFRKNGDAWIKSANPANGTNGLDISADYTAGKAMIPAVAIYYGGVGSLNFGNGYFANNPVSSAGSNASGNGIFEYDVPTGFTALSTKGLNL